MSIVWDVIFLFQIGILSTLGGLRSSNLRSLFAGLSLALRIRIIHTHPRALTCVVVSSGSNQRSLMLNQENEGGAAVLAAIGSRHGSATMIEPLEATSGSFVGGSHSVLGALLFTPFK